MNKIKLSDEEVKLMFEKLGKIYYNIDSGFNSLDKFIKKVQQKENIPTKIIELFYKSQPVNQVLKVSKPQKEFSSIRAEFPTERYQIDIIVYDRYEYHNYKYILSVIDIYSRFAQCKPLTNRQLPTIIKAYKEILDNIPPPNTIQSDNEFNKKDFIDFCKSTGTENFIFSDPNELNKNAVVERFNKTIAGLIQKVRLSLKRYDWYKYLDNLVDNYNNTHHSTIGHTPYEVYSGEDENDQNYNTIEQKFKIGDKVRYIIKKKIFDKGDVVKTSDTIHMIEDIKGHKYQLSDLKKLYKPYELVLSNEIDNTDYIDKIGKDYITNENKEQEEEPKNNKRVKKIMKQEGIDLNNIIEGKRERKPKVY